MQNNKFIIFLKALSISEIKDFEQFIVKNSTKGSKDLKTFFAYLRKLHPEFPESKINREKVAKKMFPKDANKFKKIENILYKLRQLLKSFMIQEELKREQKHQDFLYLKALRRRKLDKYFFKQVNQVEEEWQKTPESGIEHLHDIYRLKTLRHSHPNYLGAKVSSEYKHLIQLIDQYYCALKLYWTLCAYNTNSYINNADNALEEKVFPIAAILDFIDTKSFDTHYPISLLKQILKVIIEKDFQQYSIIKAMFFQEFERFSKQEKNDLLVFLTQICYENFKKGEKNALNELFELKRFSVEKEIIFEDGYIASDLFQNIVNIACAAQQLEWVESFINDYAIFLLEDERKDTVSLVKSNLYFNKKEYEKVLEELALLKFHNVFYGIQARAIKLQAYYELEGYEESFFNLISSFNLLLYRNEHLSENHKKDFSNFLFFIKKLQKAKILSSSNIHNLCEKIIACEELVYKSWLLAKVNILSKKNT